MQCLTQLVPPTAVSHCVSLPFLSASANNLIVAKNSLLQVFSLKSIVLDAPETASITRSKAARKERVQTTKLVLVAQHELSGTVTGLSRVKILRSKSGGEALLVALKDAKLSLVEWDPERYGLCTVSIHFYEREDLQGIPWAPTVGQCVNHLTVDPSSRCAVLKFGARHIAILPFHQAGDDLVMGDLEPDTNSNPRSTDSPTKVASGGVGLQMAYGASFVLSLLALDPSLIHPIDLAFLHGYREPTFGVLSSQAAASSSLLHERRDPLSYTVYTLDLEQRESTTLLSITKLPYDLHTVLPLPSPIGGALLIGLNEIIHVDQSGKTNGVAVNEFALKNTEFSLPSEAHLGLRLEGCIIERLGAPNGDMLIVLNRGDLAILRFRIDGRSVSGLSVHPVEHDDPRVLLAGASSSANIGRGRIFIGSEDGDSVVLGWTSRSTKLKRQKSATNSNLEGDLDIEDFFEDDDLEDEDDLYATNKVPGQDPVQSDSPMEDGSTGYSFRLHDSLVGLAPLADVKLVSAHPISNDDKEGTQQRPPKQELLATTGRGRASALTKLSPGIVPYMSKSYDLANLEGAWSCTTKNAHKNIIITSDVEVFGEEQSHAYTLSAGVVEELPNSDFDSTAGATVAVGTLDNGSRIVQVLKNEIRAYDEDFSLAQIFPLSEDPNPTDSNVIAASFAEPYVLLSLDDSTVRILRADEAGDMEEIEQSEVLSKNKWVSGSLFDDSSDVFRLETDEEDEDEEGGSMLMFLLTTEGGLQIFRLASLKKPVYAANGLSFLPTFLSEDFIVRRSAAKETIAEILVTEIGDSVSKAPYMILRSAADDLTIYQPYQTPQGSGSGSPLRFLKSAILRTPKSTLDGDTSDSGQRAQALQALYDLDGYSTVFMSGLSPCVILKSASTNPEIVALEVGGTKSFSSFQSPDTIRGFLYVDDQGGLKSAQLPPDSNYVSGWRSQKIFSGEEIVAFDYHEKTDRYVLGMNQKVTFKLPDDELHPEWSGEGDSFLPQLDQDAIKVLDPTTSKITDTHPLELGEVIMCIKTMSLEVSEHTHAREPLIVVGTSLIQGEDLPAKGRIYIFDINHVVPELDSPETGLKLKLIAKEEVKGGVTSLTEIGTEGFLLAAQGQKCMVRGLKEDGTLLPVAFIDTQCYVAVAKELDGTGLCILADAVKGVWLAGYMEEPYQLRLFGKSAQHIEVVTAEFMPDGENLYTIVVDAEGIMHVLQFEPHNPKSLTGQRLLHLSSYNTGAYPSTMTLLPQSPVSRPPPPPPPDIMDTSPPPHIASSILLTSQTGSISLLTSLTPASYRTLTALQSYLTNTLPHPLALNARAYRAVEADQTVGGRAILDGDILKRWMELGSWKRVEGVGRAGLEAEWEVRELLDQITGNGLGVLKRG